MFKKVTCLMAVCLTLMASSVFANEVITIETANTSLILKTNDAGRLYQSYYGKKLSNANDYGHLPQGIEAYLTNGMEDYFEPALHIVHADGNPSTLLKYVSHQTSTLTDGATETVITLTDPVYKDEVKLHFIAYKDEDILKEYTEITNREKKPIVLEKYASSVLSFDRSKYYMTEFCGSWANEANPVEQELTYGKKVVDSKLGTRANLFVSPFFQLAFDQPAQENQGDIVVGTLGWTGNFRFTFEVDDLGKLRVISGINPYASEYTIAAGETFRTPEFIFTYGSNGKGEVSRKFHRWARNYQVKEGQGDRMVLLNNWEATYFDFNEEKLVKLIGEAKELGVDLFLLDDGWFANKYPRSSDHQGLGDWEETANKLPNGIGRLTEAAKENGVKFGLWIEPEMVNPKSELYENHPDWVIHFPNREEYYFRHQLVLDLSNPKVQDYVFSIVDNLKTKYPEIAYFKWDCNSPITNIYSYYLKNKQSHLYVDYVRGLYNVLDRVKAKYPDLVMMMCSGGGGRTDYKGLEYFTEMWPSDNTNPVERLYIQWGFSQIFPSKVLSAHVTTWNRSASVKFRTNVAMMGKLGFDIKLDDMSKEDVAYCKQAIKNYNRLKPVILEGDLYRLVSPYGNEHTASMFVSVDKSQAVLFAFDIYPRETEHLAPVCLQGLDANRTYRVQEIDLVSGEAQAYNYSGAYLMNHGLHLFSTAKMRSRVFEIVAQ